MSQDPAKKEQILIAEDSPPNRKILAHLLEKLGYEVIACDSGKQGWETLQKGPHDNLVAILSDVMMPEMDGISFLRAVRESEKFISLPFVLVTAVSDKDYILQARALNVSGYILKPVTFQRVQGKLQELFPQKVFPKVAG